MAVTGGLRLVLFGAPRIELDSRPASVDTRKALALAAYLAVTRQPQTRDALAGLLWPEYDPGRARATLRRTLSALHGALGGRYLAIVRETVALGTTADRVWTDVGAFAERLAACATHGHAPTEVCAVCLPLLTEAAALAHEDFLAGFGLRDSPEFDDWQYQQRERFRRELAGALERLALGQSARGDFAAALGAAGRRLALDRLDEPAHQLLMRVYAWAGQRTAALRQYRVCVQALEQELGVAPLEATTRLYEAIKENHMPPLPRLVAARSDGRAPARAPGPPAASSGELASDADSTAAGQPRLPAPAALGPLVGREREWARLLEAYQGIEADGRVVLLVGEAGIGKTRLAAELLAHVRARGAAVIEARCYEGEAHLAYGPLAAALRAVVAERGRGWLDGLATPWEAEVTRLLPELAVRTGSSGGGEGGSSSSASASAPGPRPGAQGHFYEGLRLALTAACDAGVTAEGSRPPGVLFVDDAQWADGASLALLAYLVRRLQGQRMLLLLACRADAEPSEELESLLALVRRSAEAVTVELARLGPDEVRALVEVAELPSERLAQVAERLYQETDGLPFFVAEYLAALRGGLLAPDETEWTPPGGVRELLRSRLGTVSETGWQALTAAAVIGRSFTFEELREVSGRGEEETVGALEELIGRGLVHETASGIRAEMLGKAGDGRDSAGEPLYDFAHEKLRALVYAETSLARRRLLHRRAAEALARGAAARRDEGALAGQIAQHYLLAGNEAAAAEAYRTAGEYARRVYANAEALEQFQRALALGHPDGAALHEAIGDLRTLAGAYAEALRSYETAAALVAGGAMARIEQKLGNVYARRGEWAASESHYEAALEALEAQASAAVGTRRGGEPDGTASAQAELLVDWALTAHHGVKTPEARRLAQRALGLAEASGDARALARVHNLLGMLASARGEHAEAQRHLERSLAAADELGDPVVRVAALNNLALVYGASGEHERALGLAETALAACAALGDRHREAALHNNLADLLHALGRSDEALAHLRQAVTIYAEIGVEEGDVRPEIWKLSEW
ncbi:MAG TPA: AAA family ATPase [Ktedonobacterales bacterium]|nr:AAA family ATPase [Ktedonobacterales bacterium]